MSTTEKKETLPSSDPEPWREVDGRLIPLVGIGASHGYGSDCYPYTVVAVSKTGHQIMLRRDDAKVVSGSFIEGNAVCDYTSRPEHVDEFMGSSDRIATRRNNQHRCGNCGSLIRTCCSKVTSCAATLGCREVKQRWLPVYRMKGSTGRGAPSVGIGYRRYYQDPHF